MFFRFGGECSGVTFSTPTRATVGSSPPRRPSALSSCRRRQMRCGTSITGVRTLSRLGRYRVCGVYIPFTTGGGWGLQRADRGRRAPGSQTVIGTVVPSPVHAVGFYRPLGSTNPFARRVLSCHGFACSRTAVSSALKVGIKTALHGEVSTPESFSWW